MEDNPYADAARIRKAYRLADALLPLFRQNDIVYCAAAVAEMPEALRRAVCTRARVNVASAETWAMVGDVVAERGECWPHEQRLSDGRCIVCGKNPV